MYKLPASIFDHNREILYSAIDRELNRARLLGRSCESVEFELYNDSDVDDYNFYEDCTLRIDNIDAEYKQAEITIDPNKYDYFNFSGFDISIREDIALSIGVVPCGGRSITLDFSGIINVFNNMIHISIYQHESDEAFNLIVKSNNQVGLHTVDLGLKEHKDNINVDLINIKDTILYMDLEKIRKGKLDEDEHINKLRLHGYVPFATSFQLVGMTDDIINKLLNISREQISARNWENYLLMKKLSSIKKFGKHAFTVDGDRIKIRPLGYIDKFRVGNVEVDDNGIGNIEWYLDMIEIRQIFNLKEFKEFIEIYNKSIARLQEQAGIFIPNAKKIEIY